ncbi:hypothetical protein AB0L05_27835 [Nonomuraea pusilla]|uniref:hypothetical protein n=1 Tax=Nonomuraea pusilla TaxID=46177 RepID=UPI00332B78CD
MIRRLYAWARALYLAPASSSTAALLRNLAIPAAGALAAVSLLPFWGRPPMATVMDVVWLSALLYVVRQRDAALAAAAPHHRNETP